MKRIREESKAVDESPRRSERVAAAEKEASRKKMKPSTPVKGSSPVRRGSASPLRKAASSPKQGGVSPKKPSPKRTPVHRRGPSEYVPTQASAVAAALELGKVGDRLQNAANLGDGLGVQRELQLLSSHAELVLAYATVAYRGRPEHERETYEQDSKLVRASSENLRQLSKNMLEEPTVASKVALRKATVELEAVGGRLVRLSEVPLQQRLSASNPFVEHMGGLMRQVEAWKKVFLVGTEWYLYDQAFRHDWDFGHFETAVQAGGRLHTAASDDDNARYVYVFGVTEPQYLPTIAEDPEWSEVVTIPALVAVLSKKPLDVEVALKSVQKAEEEIVAMEQLKLHWAPQLPGDRLMFLHCTARYAQLRHLADADIVRYQYALPYIWLPRVQRKIPIDTAVHLLVDGPADSEGRATTLPPLDYDYRQDGTVEEFLDMYLEDLSDVPAGLRESLTEQLTAAVAAKRAVALAERDRRRAMLEALPPDELDSLETLQILKFYPRNPMVQGSTSRFVNRYFGQADEILQ